MRGKGVQLRAHNVTCEGKQKFDSYDLATRLAKKRSRAGKKNHVYRCGNCNAFHLGGKIGPSRFRPHDVLFDDEAFA